MKKFTKKVLIFILIAVVIAIPVDYAISNYIKSKTTYAQGEISVWNDIYEGNINSEILIYGSSRAWVHFSPSIIEKKLNFSAYNLGIDGHNFWLEYMRHIIYLKHNKTPKYIIFSLDSFTLEKTENLYNFQQFLPYMLFNNDIVEYTSSYNGFTLADYYLPMCRYINKSFSISSLENIDNSSKRIKGYKGQTQNWNINYELEKKESYNVNLDSNSIKLFEKFIKNVKSSKIELIFVYSPEHILGQEHIKNRSEIIDLYNKISKKHKIPFLDYSNNKICANKKYFYNALHLNKEGADLFTEILASDLKIIINNEL